MPAIHPCRAIPAIRLAASLYRCGYAVDEEKLIVTAAASILLGRNYFQTVRKLRDL